jgi:anthranilate synthase component 1
MSASPALLRRVELPAAALRQLAYSDAAHFPVLLDSSATGPLGRYSILGAFPQGALWLDRDGQLHTDGLARVANSHSPGVHGFVATLQSMLLRESERRHPGLRDGDSRAGEPAAGGPFRGGWMLFLSYEMAAGFEPRLQLPRPEAMQFDAAAPMALALRIPAALSFDHQSGEAWLTAESDQPELLEELEGRLARLRAAPAVPHAFRGACRTLPLQCAARARTYPRR